MRRLSDALLPLAVLTMGLSVRFAPPRDELRPLAAVTPRSPAAGAAAGQQGPIARLTVLEAAVPSMVTAGALAIAHGGPAGGGKIGYGLLLPMATLPRRAACGAGG